MPRDLLAAWLLIEEMYTPHQKVWTKNGSHALDQCRVCGETEEFGAVEVAIM
jgi:hypothetical protein